MSAVADPFAPEALRSVPVPMFYSEHVIPRRNPLALPVLALDLGESMGFALRTSACITSGTMKWPLRAREKRGDRLLRIWRWLHEIHGATPLSLIAYEVVHHMGPKQVMAAHAWAQYQGVVEMFAARQSVPTKTIAVSTLKKAITGRGTYKAEGGRSASQVGKEAMMAAVRALGYHPDTHDEADAIGVLEWAIR